MADKNATHYFWYWRPQDNWPPSPVEEPSDIRPDGRLNIACTQTNRNSYQQRKLVAKWCELLPRIEGVRHLWLNSRVPQRLFDAACNVPGLESLYIKWSGIKNLDSVTRAKTISHLHIGSSTGLTSIEPLRGMNSLQWLGLESVTRISSLEPISELALLKGLTLEGSMWTTQYVETLKPIGKLRNLEYLSIANLRSRDRTLEPLFSLTKLQVFNAAQWWDTAELSEIERRNPGLSA